jgi:hypothetical protein
VFEVLHGAFVLFGGGATAERAEVTALAGSRVGFSRIQAVFARGEFANHGGFPFFSFPISRAPDQAPMQSMRRKLGRIPQPGWGISQSRSRQAILASEAAKPAKFDCFRW